MRNYQNAFKEQDGQTQLSDDELLTQFQRNPQQAWHSFIDRYADLIFSSLRGMGFDYDQAMDRFVYVCEKLSEKDFRLEARLFSVRKKVACLALITPGIIIFDEA